MKPDFTWIRGALAAAVLALALPATAQAPARPAPLPLDREITLPGSAPREVLEFLQRGGIPFQFDLRITMRCTGALCSGVVRPSDLAPSPERLAQCLAECRSADAPLCAGACRAAYDR